MLGSGNGELGGLRRREPKKEKDLGQISSGNSAAGKEKDAPEHQSSRGGRGCLWEERGNSSTQLLLEESVEGRNSRRTRVARLKVGGEGEADGVGSRSVEGDVGSECPVCVRSRGQ